MKRELLLSDVLENQSVSEFKIEKITFEPDQQAPYHQHPCPVVGYITEGTCLMQIEGEPSQLLSAGNGFYEPANTPILHFDNHSQTERMVFVAVYLLDGQQNTVEILPTH